MLTAQHQRLTVRTLRLSEQQVTAQIVDWLQYRGWTAHRKHVGEFIAYAWIVDWLAKLMEEMRRGGLTAVREATVKALREFPRRKVTLGRAGLPDWLFTHPRYHPALYIEMKATGQKPVPLQLATLEQLRRDGYRAEWFNDFDVFHKWYMEAIASGEKPARTAGERSA